ncbi:MAG TPA: AmmeMemoRadiSam system protein A [Polyangia bacterium]|nr:AmmeMemoRadiSam system protein A [Polyangia bacterium]
MTADGADPATIGEADRRALLALSRRAIAGVATGHHDEPGASPPGLDRSAAVFVTVRVVGELRGCIGSFEPRPSLWAAVFELATAAATRDPRFLPVAAGDLEQLSIEISVLAPPRVIHSPAELILGKHGVEIRNGTRRGVLLPQVATEHGLDTEALLGETCRKAGLSRFAWRDAETEIRVFEAEIFHADP